MASFLFGQEHVERYRATDGEEGYECEDPAVEAQIKGDVFAARARTATPEEKREAWPTMVSEWPAYAEYQASTEREIPVVVLERT